MNDSIPALSSEFLSFVKVVKPQNFIGKRKLNINVPYY